MVRQYDKERSGPYRSRNGIILGVCKGISDYLDFPVFWIRVLTIFFLSGSAGSAIVIYFVAAILMKPEPIIPLETDEDTEFYNSYSTSRSMALSRLKRTFDRLDRRIQRMEQIVTKRDYDWDRRLNE